MENYAEKATELYNFNKENNSELLENVLIDLADKNEEPIFYLSDWLDNFNNNMELIKIMEQSNHFDTDDTYIMQGVYRWDYVTGDWITKLIGDEKAIEWIAIALEYDPEAVADLDKYVKD